MAQAAAARAASPPTPRGPRRSPTPRGSRARPEAPRTGERRPRAPARLRPIATSGGRAAAAPAPEPRTAYGLLDRLLRDRAWIACVFVLLVGIVFLNVRLLVLDGGIARDAARAVELKRENATLRLRAARLGSSERIQRVAAERGLVWPAPGRTRYLLPDPSVDARLAAKTITAPAPAKSAASGAPAAAGPAAPGSPDSGVSSESTGASAIGASTTTGAPTATGASTAPGASGAPTGATGASSPTGAPATTSSSIPSAE